MISPAQSRTGTSIGVWWGLGSLFILVFAVRDFQHSVGGVIDNSVYWGRDFVNVWTGGRLVREGRIELLNDLQAYAAYQRSLFGDIGPHNYSYPPVTYPLAALFSLLPYWVALVTWTASTGALFVHAARKWWPTGMGPAYLALVTPAALLNIWAGHYGFLIGALFLLGWQKLDERPVQSGVYFGLMLLKPHLAVLVPLALLLRREWAAIASAAATVALLVIITGAWFGWQSWNDFLFNTSAVQASMIDPKLSFFGLMSCSVATALLRIGAPWAVAAGVQLLYSGAAVALVGTAAVSKVRTRDLALLSATATFVFLPYSFNYDLTVVMLGALVVLRESKPGSIQSRLAIGGFVSPQIGMILSAFYMPLLPVALAALAYAQFRHAMENRVQADGVPGARLACGPA